MLQAVSAMITTIIKEGAKIYAPIALFCTILLFLPDRVIERIGLYNIVKTYKPAIGLILLLSVSMLIPILSNIVFSPINEYVKKQRVYSNMLANLKITTDEEKAYLRLFIQEGKNTVSVPLTDGVMGGLSARGIVYKSASIGSPFNWPYNLEPIARKLLQKFPHIIE